MDKDIEITTHYDHEESCAYIDPKTVWKLKEGVKRHGYTGSLNELHGYAQHGKITFAEYYEAKKDYNEHRGQDRNFMIPAEFH